MDVGEYRVPFACLALPNKGSMYSDCAVVRDWGCPHTDTELRLVT